MFVLVYDIFKIRDEIYVGGALFEKMHAILFKIRDQISH